MIEFIVKVVLSYLLGSVIGSLVVGRLYGGVDIRKEGSGNAGATNALRTRGKGFAVWVLLIDILKGVIAVSLASLLDSIPGIRQLLPPGNSTEEWYLWQNWAIAAAGIAVLLGHVYPLWHGFKGGKGVATLVGVVLVFNPFLVLPMLGVWLLAVMLLGYVGLASMLATLSIPVAAFIGLRMDPAILTDTLGPARIPFQTPLALMLNGGDERLFVFGVAAVVLIVITHRSNLARMRAGTEPRVRKLWLFRGKRT